MLNVQPERAPVDASLLRPILTFGHAKADFLVSSLRADHLIQDAMTEIAEQTT